MKNINEILENDKEFLNIFYKAKIKLLKYYINLYIIFILISLFIGAFSPIFTSNILVIVLISVIGIVGYLLYTQYKNLKLIKDELLND